MLSDFASCGSLQKAKSKGRLHSQSDAHFVIANHMGDTFNLEKLFVELGADAE